MTQKERFSLKDELFNPTKVNMISFEIKEDDDFGHFIYTPNSHYVATYGCCDEYLNISLQALRKITRRFSAEFSIRDFINSYPIQTLAILKECANHLNDIAKVDAALVLETLKRWTLLLSILFEH